MYNRYQSPTVLGIDEKWERVLCYVLGWLSGIVFLIIEQRNHNVRRHAMQSILIFGGLSLLIAVAAFFGWWLGGIWIIGPLFHLAFGLVTFLLRTVFVLAWLGLIVLAYLQPDFFLPLGRRYQTLLG